MYTVQIVSAMFVANLLLLLLFMDSRARQHHYIKKWSKRGDLKVGENNIKLKPLIKKENIILPPLHIKPELIKNFVEALHI